MSRFDEEHQRSLFATERAPSTMDGRIRAKAPAPVRASGGWRPWLAPVLGAALAVAAVLGAATARQMIGVAPERPATSANPPDAIGVPPDVELTPHTGDLLVDSPGAVVEGLLVTGRIVVSAPGVTIRHTRVRPPAGAEAAVRQGPGAANLTVEDIEIAAPVAAGVRYGVYQEAAGLTVRRADLHGMAVGALVGDGAVLTDNHIHDLATVADATGIRSSAGARLAIIGNTVLAPADGGAGVDLGAVSTMDIRGNLLGGGRYALRFGTGATTAVTVVGNRFSRAVWPTGGRDGPSHAWDPNAPGNVWSANVWDGTADLVEP